jgi:hypothetical protein
VNCERNSAGSEKKEKKTRKGGGGGVIKGNIRDYCVCVTYREFGIVVLDKLQLVWLQAERGYVHLRLGITVGLRFERIRHYENADHKQSYRL